MMIEIYEIVALCICFLGSGFYSGSEAVLLSIGHDRAKQLISKGGSIGGAMAFAVKRPNEILTTILVGNNVVNILAASLVTTITARVFDSEAVGISTGITTIIILFFGEIIPKTFARSRAEGLALVVIRILQLNFYLFYPIIRPMTSFIQTLLGANAKLSRRLITKDDIEYMVSKAEKEKTIDSKQIELLTSILEFPTIKVKDIMITRNRVKFLRKDLTFDDIIEIIKEDNHSRYPVCEQDLDSTVGFLHVKDLAFSDPTEKEHFSVDKYLKPPFFVYEHMKIQAVFDHMNRKKVHLALVKDENGLVVGIITLEDIIEEIFGEIEDEHDMEDHVEKEDYDINDLETGILVDGKISIRDLYNEFDIKIPLNPNFSTLAGFILDMLGNNFPEEGQIIVWEGLSFELEKVDNYEIREIRIRHVGGEKHIFSKKEAEEEGENDT